MQQQNVARAYSIDAYKGTVRPARTFVTIKKDKDGKHTFAREERELPGDLFEVKSQIGHSLVVAGQQGLDEIGVSLNAPIIDTETGEIIA